MATKKHSSTTKRKAATKSKPRAGTLEVHSKLNLLDFEDEIEHARELIKTSDYLLSGILQDLGRENDNVATVIAVVAMLEKAGGIQQGLVDEVVNLHIRLRDAGVTISREETQAA
jgi:hypothetical protein